MNDQAMNEALDNLSEQVDPSTFTAANGLKLRLKRVSQMIIADANRRLKPPKPPVTWNPDKERNEENPQHPDYIEALSYYRFDTAMLAMRVYFILGTEVEYLPRDIEPVDSTVWSDAILAADAEAEIPESGPRRYLAWLKLYALPDEDQARLLNAIIGAGNGTLEAQVVEAQNSFRNNSRGDTIDGVPLAATHPGGDRDADGVGDGAGIRSEGSSGLRALPVGGVGQPELI